MVFTYVSFEVTKPGLKAHTTINQGTEYTTNQQDAHKEDLLHQSGKGAAGCTLHKVEAAQVQP